MTKDEALRLALEYVELVPDDRYNADHIDRDALTAAIKAALEAKDEKPLCYAAMFDKWFLAKSGLDPNTPLYTTPPQRKPLTDEEIIECDKIAGLNHTRHHRSIKGQQMSPADDFWWHFARAIEAAHGIKGEA